jgi:putative endonuclease
MSFFVYMVVSEKDGSLYTGQTSDIKARLERHNRGLIRTTKSRAPHRLGYVEEYTTRSEAMWREWELKKQYNTERKRRMIAGFEPERINTILGL